MVSVLLLSCTEKQPESLPFEFDENLQNIDTLLQYNAADALQKLLSCHSEYEVRGTSLNYNDSYRYLLLSEALYKTDNPQYYRNELQTAMQYFDSIAQRYPANDDLTVLSARSHYMNGVGFYENDSVVDACKEYLHTLEIMEDHFDVEKLRGYKAKFMGLTYTRLGEVYYNYGLAKPALDAFKNALTCFMNLPNYSLANTYRGIGNSYRLDNNNDSALYYCRKALNIANNNDFVYSSLLSEFAPVYYELNYIDSAFMMIRESFLLPMNDDQRLAKCFTIGYLYQKQGQCDSAIYYLSQSIKRESFATQTVSAELLMNCYEALGDTVSASYYKEIYGGNFTKYRNYSFSKTELNKVYDEYVHKQRQNANQVHKNTRNRQTLLSWLALIAIITVIGVIYKLKHHKTMVETNTILAEKDKALDNMKRKMEAMPLIDEPICKSILTTTNQQHFKSKVSFEDYKEFALSKDQLLLLRDAVDRHYDNFTQRLSKDYPELTYDDIDYCCLYLLGLKDAEISALLQRAYPTVHQRSNKIKRIFNTKESLQSAIVAMASQPRSGI
jgi:hypothetical protein